MKSPVCVSKVTDDVPIPDKRGTKYPFGKMAVGDSFTVTGGTYPLNVAHAAIVRYRKRHPEKKFTIRTECDGARVWRIA